MYLIIFLIIFLGFPDPLELATGIEKKEMLLRLAGNDVSIIFKLISKDLTFINYYFVILYCVFIN